MWYTVGMRRIQRQQKKRWPALLLALALCISVCGCTREAPDPHAGMVEVFNGAANDWITPKEQIPVSTLVQADFSGFPDAAQVSAYAVTPMAWANAGQLVCGVGTDRGDYLQPQADATRAQVATILMRLAGTGA